MKILIDIGHPAHVHLFRNFATQMSERGHEILFTAREKENESALLDAYLLKYHYIGRHIRRKLFKPIGLFWFTFRILKVSLSFKPDIFLSHGSIYAAYASFILRKPHISLEDSGNMEQIRLYRPFTACIITPDILPENLGDKQIRVRSYHELAYLYHLPIAQRDEINTLLGLRNEEKYCVIRIVSWKASHDIGNSGLSRDQLLEIISIIEPVMRVFISSESGPLYGLEKYNLKIPPEKIHSVLFRASLFVGEGATMASEAGLLGTTSVYVNSIKRSYCEDQEKFNLVFNFREGEAAIRKIKHIITDNQLLTKRVKERENLLKDKIDLSGFLVWFAENFPESEMIMKRNPEYQFKYKV